MKQRKKNGSKVANHSIGPEGKVVDQKPSLLGKAYRLLVSQAQLRSNGVKQPVNNNGSGSCKAQHGADDEVDIIQPLRVLSSLGVIVRQLEVWSRVCPERWNESVYGEYRTENRERAA